MLRLIVLIGLMLLVGNGFVHAQDKRAEKAALKEANRLYKQLKNGADFAKTAASYSDDAGSASEGGKIGMVKKGMLVPEYEKAMLALKPGEVSKPVRSEYGYHLIQLLRVKDDTYETRHILIRVE